MVRSTSQIPNAMKSSLLPVIPIAVILGACAGSATDKAGSVAVTSTTEVRGPLLRSVPPDSSGVHFTNTLIETDSMNYFNFENMYNGGGIAIGDVNGDGLADLYFTGNQVDDRLYLNKGGLRFEDVTAKALPKDQHGWHTGVTMGDANGDGKLDIYVCRGGIWSDPSTRTNRFYQNAGNDGNGIPVFKERARELGIADTTRSDQAVFFDHDLDGDLDLYVINTSLQGKEQLSPTQVEELLKTRRSPTSRLYRNDGARFTDITEASGLLTYGYALGVSVSDLDGDGRQDIYVANDYVQPDRMYMRNAIGGYTESIQERTRHISNFAMGCDVADYNNDGLVDIAVVDMVSEDHVRSKTNMGGMSSEKFWTAVLAGFHYQYMFNTLQLNNGNGTFSEVGQLAGVSKTDWSWAPLFCDLDNDGWKDLMVTNGYLRDVRDNDYVLQATRMEKEKKQQPLQQALELIPSQRIRNYVFRNNGDLTFQDNSGSWGFTEADNSNGAAYADLDLDGDLDLVINNLEAAASLYENRAVQQGTGHWLRVKLEGAGGASAMGAKVHVRAGGIRQLQELMLTRGFQSSVEPVLHFGLGSASTIDDVHVVWPDGTVSDLTGVKADQVLEVQRSTARRTSAEEEERPMFTEVAEERGLDFKHKEDPYDDMRVEVLLPHDQSRNGPLFGSGDANGDGLPDLFIGGAAGQSGLLYLQRGNGGFALSPYQPWSAQAGSEDMGSLFFDADADGDQDLCIASGSNEVNLPLERFKNRLYLNDGKGVFALSPQALPSMEPSAMRMAAADIDGDKDLDLFVGGRVVPGQYPKAPRSYLLLNDGHGRFTDVTGQQGPALLAPGLVTDAEFMDYDGDQDPDLVVVGEWMPISFYENRAGHFVPANDKCGLNDTEGWWWSLTSGDIDGDGDPDLVCGNLGWNHKFHCSPEHPFHVFWNDFDANGRGDIVLAKEYGPIGLVPVRGRECSSQQCPMIQKKFGTYDAFAYASVEQIYTPELISSSLHLQARHMRSCVLLNQGKGRFTLTDLPNQAQVAPIMGSALFDADGDGKMDLFVAGNHWGAEVETIRYDAGTGLLLLGDGKGGFSPQTIARSGIFAWNNVKDVALLRTGENKEPLIVIANNDDRVQAFALARGSAVMVAARR